VTVFEAPMTSAYEAEIMRAVEWSLANHLIDLAESAAMPQVRALATARLTSIAERRVGGAAGRAGAAWTAHRDMLATDVGRFLDRSYDATQPAEAPGPPPGAPIGDTGLDYLLGLDVCRVR